MGNGLLYHEILTSKRTLTLFMVLTGVFFVLSLWRILITGFNFLAVVLVSLFVFFLFYSVNYRRLEICLTKDSLKLKFGLFKWCVSMKNIAECKLDEISSLAYFGGAGIHFMFVTGRYRASFNFLEYPRVVIAFTNKIGPIQDLSFSTQNPEMVLKTFEDAIEMSGK